MTSFVQLADDGREHTKMTWGARHRTVDEVNRHLEMGFEVGWNTAVDQLNELAHRLWVEQKTDGVPSQFTSTEVDQVRTSLWFEMGGEEAAKFYTNLLPNSQIERVYRPNPEHEALFIDFTLKGIPYQIVNGGPHYQLSPAASILILTETQQEIDELWDSLIQNGGQAFRCGWLTDRFGLTWQIIPIQLLNLLCSADSSKNTLARTVMMQSQKINIDRLIEAAAD